MTHTHLTAATAFWKSPMAAELIGTRKTERLRNSNYLYHDVEQQPKESNFGFALRRENIR